MGDSFSSPRQPRRICTRLAAAQAVKSQVRISVTVTDTVRYFILKENWGKMKVNEMRVEKTRKAEFLAVGEAYKATF